MKTENHSQTAAFIWPTADLLRGDFKLSQYGRIILPFTLLRRLECVLASTKKQVLAAAQDHANKPGECQDKVLRASKSRLTSTSSHPSILRGLSR
ncbi:type I restriction-modification system subunit M N-terminal domain-containing protein [Halomonas sp. M20]|uniref:type I restriction-modification system subunit M N-terminal domain-containing protein n=1 Tax=Halomonas sp. M20 TaxID=2763264 RepID=UPI001D0B23A0|nr:type I restriction-modification system subunit M N-terminal domain-containing protein [Halomonas sp. M20]